MYLFRLPNCVYYTRIATSLSLRERGYPKELKFSLLTRERKVAYLRNIEQVQLILGLFDKAMVTKQDFADFKAELADAINGFRQHYRHQTETTIQAPKITSKPKRSKAPIRQPVISHDTLNQFIESKQLESITNLTLKQLQQRCGDFLDYLAQQKIEKPTNSHAMNYRDELLKKNLSHKTLKDYITSNKQFFN